MLINDWTVKDYLRLDSDEDISLYVDAAENYFREAVGIDPDPASPLQVIAVCAITQEFYDCRTMITQKKPNEDRLRHIVASILDQVRLNQIGGDDDGV